MGFGALRHPCRGAFFFVPAAHVGNGGRVTIVQTPRHGNALRIHRGKRLCDIFCLFGRQHRKSRLGPDRRSRIDLA